MLKLSNLLQLRNRYFPPRLFGEDLRSSLRLYELVSRAGIATGRQRLEASGTLANRVFAPYTVYKGKAALSARPVLPTFSQLDSGGFKVDRRGSIMFTFWPSVGERKYDWEKKQVFALSETEVGALISLGSLDSCEFFHDPAMLSSNAGQVRKSLTIKSHADGSGYFISLNVVNNILNTNERFTVPVTTAEFAVMRTAFSFALPHIMGWNHYTNPLSKGMSGNPSEQAPDVMSLEWEK